MAQQNIAAAATCPCDIYAAGGTPCVAAHSTVRLLLSTYTGPLYKINYNQSNESAVIGYTLQDARRVSMDIFDQQGRRIAAIVNGVVGAGRHEAVWDAKRVPAGVYI